jgi:hypothetical protein
MKINIAKFNKRIILIIAIILGLICLSIVAFRYSYNPNYNEKEQALSFKEKCKNVLDFRRCYTPLFTKLAQKTDVDIVLNTLIETQKIDERLNDCHYLAHEITFVAIKKDPIKWNERLQKMNLYWCSTGFLHGTILSLGLEKGAPINQIKQLDQFCKRIMDGRNDEGFIESSCYHSTGHVFLIENGGRVDLGLKVCELYDTEKKQYFCYNGLFMETVQRDALVDHGLAEKNSWSWDETLKQEMLCKSYDGLKRRACWMEMWPLYKANSWRVGNNRLDALYSLCGRTDYPDEQDKCYEYGVYTVIDNGLEFISEDEVEKTCQVYTDKKRRTECIRFMTTMFIRSNAISQANTIHKICSQATLPEESPCCKVFDKETKQQQQKQITSIETEFITCMMKGEKLPEYYSSN